MIAPHHSTSEWRPRLKSAGDPMNGGCFTDWTFWPASAASGEIVRLRAHTQANVRT